MMVPTTVMNTELPKDCTSLLEEKMYLYASRVTSCGMMNMGLTDSSYSEAKDAPTI